MSNKRYFWLKLKEDFFEEKYIKALRKLPDGDALVIVYLKMQLKSLKTEGFIKYEHILPSAEEELALFLDEDINKVRLAITALLNMGIVEKWDDNTFYMAAMQELIGSETAVAARVRRHRALKTETPKALQCNSNVTTCNTEKEKEKEKEKDIDIDIKKEKEKEKEKENENPSPKNSASDIYKGEFDVLWAEYPNKKGKDKALKAYIKARKSGATCEEVATGIRNYKAEIARNKTAPEYIKHGATWFNQKAWEDEYNTKSSAPVVGANGIKIDPNKTDLDDIF